MSASVIDPVVDARRELRRLRQQGDLLDLAIRLSASAEEAVAMAQGLRAHINGGATAADRGLRYEAIERATKFAIHPEGPTSGTVEAIVKDALLLDEFVRDDQPDGGDYA